METKVLFIQEVSQKPAAVTHIRSNYQQTVVWGSIFYPPGGTLGVGPGRGNRHKTDIGIGTHQFSDLTYSSAIHMDLASCTI